MNPLTSIFFTNSFETLFFFGFLFIVLSVVIIDLKVIGRQSHSISFREAIIWTLVWICLAMLFYLFLRFRGEYIHGIGLSDHPTSVADQIRDNVAAYHPSVKIEDITDENVILNLYRKNLALEYLTGYLIEYSLSVDNVFVIIMIFMAFGILNKYYKRVLFWGILGAIVMRFLFIFLGAALISRFEIVLYMFGGFLVYTGIQMFRTRNKIKEIDTKNHPVVKLASRYFAVYPRNVRHHFMIRKRGKIFVTPMLIVLLVIEFSDVIFAVDSVPAIFSVTKDPFIVFFSNIFAILGLRSLFFLLINIMDRFRYLKHGLSVLLTFIGFKLILHTWLEEIGFTTAMSLYVVMAILGISILASLLSPMNKNASS
ncbi:MAG: TerC/Alx family metal homeostasis membrane protein [Bacteroidetes bacterium]|nr:TerC/Alx family metal homeostasis membrane protein [Bacteroidota bacterium]